MTSQRQKNAGYLLPDQLTGHDLLCVCLKIPDVEEYRTAFLKQVWELGAWGVWEKSYQPGDTRAKEAAEYWRELLLEYLNMACGDGLLDLRQNPDDPCEVQKTYDGEIWYEAWRFDACGNADQTQMTTIENQYADILQRLSDIYDGTPTSINSQCPTDYFDGDGSDNRRMALCMALHTFVKSYFEHWRRKAEIILAGGIVVLWFGAVPILGWIAVAVIAGLAYVTQVALDAARDDDAIEEIICCMFTYLQGKGINHTEFQNSLSACGFSGGTNAAILRDILAADLPEEKNYLSFLEALGTAYPLAQAGVEDCPCGGDWLLDMDLTLDDWGWQHRVRPNPTGHYSSGVGIVSGSDGSTNRIYGWISPGITAQTWKAEITFTLAGGAPNKWWQQGWALRRCGRGSPPNNSADGTFYVGTKATTNSAGTYTDMTNGEVTRAHSTYVSLHFANPSQIVIKRVKLYGTGYTLPPGAVWL